MAISGRGWELHIVRHSQHRRATDGKRRTVGRYQVFHDGTPQRGASMKGTTAESRGPGANRPGENGKCVEPGRYPLWTQSGAKYVTIGYASSANTNVLPKPGIEMKETSERTEILVHPGNGFLSSIGCINLCTTLPQALEMITYSSSRTRVIDVIEDLKSYANSGFPSVNGRKIPNAFVIIDEEPGLWL
jgi:hypothetical protein